MIHRFYWLDEPFLAGCSRPGETPSGQNQSTDAASGVYDDLRWLRHKGIGAILSLTETPLQIDPLAAGGMDILHLPIPDLHTPQPDQFMTALAFIDWQRAVGKNVAVHCLQGQGRTGAILAAYLIRSGMPAPEAIQRLRAICPGAIGTPEQEAGLTRFTARRDWIM